MNQYYILNLNPQADYEWERCVIRNPITGEHPDLGKAIANKVSNQPGSYLIKINIEVEILEKTAIPIQDSLQTEKECLSSQSLRVLNSIV